MFQKVLVPLDHSEFAEQALGQAAAIARRSGATIDIVLVHEPLPVEGFGDAPLNAALLAAEKEYVRSVASELSTDTGVPVTSAVLAGSRVDMICKRVWDVEADLIVMTSHGRTGLSRAWVGSTADGVIRHSTTPVLMLRPVEKKVEGRAAPRPFTHILVPLDGSALAADALASAIALAQCTGAAITVLRVVSPVPLITIDVGVPAMYPFPMPAMDDAATQLLVDGAKVELAEVGRQLRNQGASSVASEVIVAGNVAQVIVDYAKEHGVDVVAMSTHGRGATRVFVGSVADKIIRASGLPVLIHRPIAVRERSGITVSSAAEQPTVLSSR
jgi:nucleotide-binding universal stress UspA family protein